MPIKEGKKTPQLHTNLQLSLPFSQYLKQGPMSQAQPPRSQAQWKHVKFQDNQANAMKEPGTGGYGYGTKNDKNKDVDTIASDFIKLKHKAWALQKSTTMYQPST